MIEPIVVLGLDELIDKYKGILANAGTYYQHVRQGTNEAYYNTLISDVVVDLALVKVNRELQELDPLDDDVDVLNNTFLAIVQMISVIFNKPFKKVKHDFLECTQSTPIPDIRSAHLLKSRNLLH